MEKTIDPIKSMLSVIKEDFLLMSDFTEQQIHIFPQMPRKQINHFVNQAINHSNRLTIQINPSIYAKQITEVSGNISISPNSKHIILNAENNELVYLIPLHSIRHLRLTL